MVSAAQNAATNITTLATTAIKMNQSGDGRARSGSGTGVLSEKEEQDLLEKENSLRLEESQQDDKSEPKKKLAVETLGMGELSLGTFLGTSTTPGSADTASTFGGAFGVSKQQTGLV